MDIHLGLQYGVAEAKISRFCLVLFFVSDLQTREITAQQLRSMWRFSHCVFPHVDREDIQ